MPFTTTTLKSIPVSGHTSRLGLDDNREKALVVELFAYFGVSSELQTPKWYAFNDKIQGKLIMAKIHKKVGKALGEH